MIDFRLVMSTNNNFDHYFDNRVSADDVHPKTTIN